MSRQFQHGDRYDNCSITRQNTKAFLRRLVVFLFISAFVTILCPLNTHADELDDILVPGSYVEGEVIAAIAADGSKKQTATNMQYQVTELTSLNSSAVEQTVRHIDLKKTAAIAVQSSETAEQLSGNVNLCVISSKTMSTKELLRMLADDPDVVFAEPNYISEAVISDRSDLSESGNAEYLKNSLGEQPEEDPAGDLTTLQWGNWATELTALAPGASENPSINVPGFGTVSGNMDQQVVVALIDTGVYYEHPDLNNVVYRFTPEQQETLGCWEWGYNALSKGAYGNVRDMDSTGLGHGTHTAGIIGAEWNGSGTSGVASNVRIVCIQLSNGNGEESLADALTAYDFINRFNESVDEEERIRVTSNSWSRYSSSLALDAVLRDLGERWGIVSVFSAGNDGKNNDRFEKTPSSSADNPYVIVVANTTPADRLHASSEYGTATVDIAAPGSNILSTTIQSRGAYYPDAVRDSNIFYAGFDEESELPVAVSQVYGDDEPILYEDEQIVSTDISEKTQSVRFFGPGCLKVEVDPDYMIAKSWDDADIYDLQFDIPLEGTEIPGLLDGAENLHFGLAYCAEGGMDCVINYASANVAFVEDEPYEDGNEGEAAPVIRPVIAGPDNFNPSSDFQWGFSDFIITSDGYLGEDVAAVSPEDNVLSVKVRMELPEGSTAVYIDSIGIGTRTVPYEFATGTSMACPAIAGAAAVYASEGYEGIELASLVRSKVRIPAGGPLATRTGGVFDFTVDGSPESGGDDKALAPAITDAEADGSLLTVRGVNFGSSPGTAEIVRYVVGNNLQPVQASVVSWQDDEVTLALDASAEGILRIVLANAGGKHDTYMIFVSKSSNIYEQDLPFDASSEDAYRFGDGDGDWETRGPVVGLGCKLYYLPAYGGQDDAYPAYRRLRSFDLKTKTWTDLDGLPEWLQDVSAVMFDGKIVVEGATMYITDSGEPSGNFPEGSSEERVYVYDPDSASWAQASSEGIFANQTILNSQGQLMLAGGDSLTPVDPDFPYFFEPAPLRSYDLSTGAGEEICAVPTSFNNPVAAAKDGTILLYNADWRLAVIRIQDGEAVSLENAGLDFYLAEEGEPVDGAWGNPIKYPYLSVLGPVSDGFVLAGPPSADGVSDTYILRDGSDVFEPYEKRASDDRVYSQAGCTYRGHLYLIGSSWFEPEKRLFRSTAMEVPEYPGDIPCEEPAAEISITYDLNGGSYNGITGKIVESYPAGTVISIHEAPVRTGYRFLYWKGSSYMPGDQYTVTEDHTFTAQWEKESDAGKDSPDTGDSTDLIHYQIAMAASLILFLALAVLRARVFRSE